MESFLEWCQEQGVKYQKVSVNCSPEAGLGLFLNKKCTEPESLLHIPANLLITTSRLLQPTPDYSPFISVLSAALSPDTLPVEQRMKLPENTKTTLRLFLAYEIDRARHSKEDNSPSSYWAPYVDQLPKRDFFYQNHVLFLGMNPDKEPEDTLLLLQGTYLGNALRAKQASLRREYETLMQHVPWDFTLDDWFYADALFWSRVVDLTQAEGDDSNDNNGTTNLALIPLFDFANHSTNPNIRWQLSAQGDGLDLVPFHFPLPSGQELFLSYGAKSNEELLFIHGFTLQDNPVPSQLSIPYAPYMNPGMGPEAGLKWQWLQQQQEPSFKPLLKWQPPVFTSSPISGFFEQSGWSMDSVCMMYLAVIDEEDGLELEYVEGDDERRSVSPTEEEHRQQHHRADDNDNDDGVLDVEKKMEHLNVSTECSTTTPVVQLYLNGNKLSTWQDLPNSILDLPHAPLVEWQVVQMLIKGVDHHIEELKSMTDVQTRNVKDASSSFIRHIIRYRNEQLNLLQQSRDILEDLSEGVTALLDKMRQEDTSKNLFTSEV